MQLQSCQADSRVITPAFRKAHFQENSLASGIIVEPNAPVRMLRHRFFVYYTTDLQTTYVKTIRLKNERDTRALLRHSPE